MSLPQSSSDPPPNENSPLIPNGRGREEGPHGWRDIIENKMTWAWYTTIMSSGGVALIIYSLPYKFNQLWVIGGIVYIASLIGFLLLLLTHVTRFIMSPRLIRASIAHPSEGLFVSTFASALGVLIIDGATYSGQLNSRYGLALTTLYWIFVIIAILFGVGTPLAQFMRPVAVNESKDSTPMALQQVLPLTLVGYAAAAVTSHIEPLHGHHSAMSIIYMGIAIQGMGILVSLLYLAVFVNNLYYNSLPQVALRPFMYLSVGPPAFTALSFALLAEESRRHFSVDSTAPGGSTEIIGGIVLYYIGMVIALMFWGLSVWLFLISASSNLEALGQMSLGTQQLQMFALIFPNVGFALATTHISRVLGDPKVLAIISEILDLVIITFWGIVVVATIFGVVSGRIFRGPI